MMKSSVALSLATLLSLTTIAGCFVESDSIDEVDPDEDVDAQDLIPIDGPYPTKPPPDTASTVTFFQNANFTGLQTTVTLTPVMGLEKMVTIPYSQVGAVGTAGAKSLRLTCGTRETALQLYAAANNTVAYLGWVTSTGAGELACTPGQTVSLALPTPLGLTTVKSVKALMHPLGSRLPIDFTGAFPTHFAAALDAELGDGAVRDGYPKLKSGGSRTFRIEQHFKLDDTFCFERKASATLSITLNGPGDVSAVVSSWYVDTPSWPEPAPLGSECQSGMESEFKAGMDTLAQHLRDTLSMSLTAFANGKCRQLQYFDHAAPENFQLVSAGAELPLANCE
ncbi:MAG: hypothetical protein U0271_25420 [Polyangiaceae bacterium]